MTKKVSYEELEHRVAYLEDKIHERKQIDEELQVSKKKYFSMMNAMKDCAYICSPEFKIEFMNSEMGKRIGADAIGKSCYKAIYNRSKKCPWCVFDKIKEEEYIEYELDEPKSNSYYSVANAPIINSDGTISKLTIFRDVSNVKEMEKQLRRAQKMESIGTLAGGIAHDFNNILFPIVGHTEMLLEDISGDHPFHIHLDQIYASAQRAKNLVEQILTFSRQENNELRLLKIQPVIKEILKFIRSTIPTTIDIKQNIQTECGVIKADPIQIHQILINLTTNAYYAMGDAGGDLRVDLKEVRLSDQDIIGLDINPGAFACLTVADTGVGMAKEVVEKIFDPFFTTKEKGKGTGMGLSVVHGIVKSMNGDIQVFSQPGIGTKINVFFPMVKSISQVPPKKNHQPLKGGTQKILLIDDEKQIINMETQMLERLGYKVTSFTSSIKALETFKSSPDKFDMVITDMTMPKMTGDKLSIELRKIRSDIPILICTGFSETMSKEKAAFLSINGFLMKPIVTKDLSQMIRNILN